MSNAGYENFFKKMNREQKRQFDKLSKEQQLDIFAAEINKQNLKVFEKEIQMSIYRGFLIACNFLYEKYVDKYLQLDPENDGEQMAKLVGECFAEIARINETYNAESKKPIEYNNQTETEKGED